MKCSFSHDGRRIPNHQNHRVTSEEHLGNKPILVHGFGLLLALAGSRQLRPHLFHVLQHHVAVAIEGFYPAQQLLVVAAVDEHLGVVLHGLREH